MFKLVQRYCGYSRQPKRDEQRRTLGVCADGQPPAKHEGESAAHSGEAHSGQKGCASLRWLAHQCVSRTSSLSSAQRRQYSSIGSGFDNFKREEFLAASPQVVTLFISVVLLEAMNAVVMHSEKTVEPQHAVDQCIRLEAVAAALERGCRGLGVEDTTRSRLAQTEQLLETLRRARASLEGVGSVGGSGVGAVERLILLVRRVEAAVESALMQLQKLRLDKKHARRLIGRRHLRKGARARAQRIAESGERWADAQEMQLVADGHAGEGATVLVYVYTTGIIITNMAQGCLPWTRSSITAAICAGAIWRVETGTGSNATTITIQHNKGDIVMRACSPQAAQSWVEASTRTMGLQSPGDAPTRTSDGRFRVESELRPVGASSLGNGQTMGLSDTHTSRFFSSPRSAVSRLSWAEDALSSPAAPRLGQHKGRPTPRTPISSFGRSPSAASSATSISPFSPPRTQSPATSVGLSACDTEHSESPASPLLPSTETPASHATAEFITKTFAAADAPSAFTGAGDTHQPGRALLMGTIRGGVKLRPVCPGGEGEGDSRSERGGDAESSVKTVAAPVMPPANTGARDVQEPQRGLLMAAVRGGVKLRPVCEGGDGEGTSGSVDGAGRMTDAAFKPTYVRRNTDKDVEEASSARTSSFSPLLLSAIRDAQTKLKPVQRDVKEIVVKEEPRRSELLDRLKARRSSVEVTEEDSDGEDWM